MTVRRSGEGAIVLDGICGVEDAEPLLQMLIATPETPVDCASCQHLHAAVLQVVLSVRPPLRGPCGDPWLEQWVLGRGHSS